MQRPRINPKNHTTHICPPYQKPKISKSSPHLFKFSSNLKTILFHHNPNQNRYSPNLSQKYHQKPHLLFNFILNPSNYLLISGSCEKGY